jgi:NADH-quinone oxidoreductase subunit J
MPIGAIAASRVLSPLLILVLCAVAGFATFLALPGRREAAIAKVGGAMVLVVFVILGALLAHYASGYGHGGMGIYFWIFSLLAVFSAFRVVTHRKPVYSALYFVLTVMASAGLFVLMWAEFMAAALVVIYAGAILVTYVFVIMLASQAAAPESKGGRVMLDTADYDTNSRDPLVAAVIGFALMGVLLFVIFDKADGAIPSTVTPPAVTANYDSSVQALGGYLMQDQLVNLELAGLILTIAMVGAIVIARRRIIMTDGVSEMVETPATDSISALPFSNTYDDPHAIPVYGTDNPAAKAYPET